MDEYIKGAESENAEVMMIDLSRFSFDPILWDGYSSKQEMEPELAEAQNLLKWADHLVFAYPLWWGGMPALLKGFIERVFLPGTAFKFLGMGKVEKMLSNKSSRIFVTMHSSPEEYMESMCAAGEKMLVDGVLNFCGITNIGTNYLGPLNKTNEKQREEWIAEALNYGKKDCQPD